MKITDPVKDLYSVNIYSTNGADIRYLNDTYVLHELLLFYFNEEDAEYKLGVF